MIHGPAGGSVARGASGTTPSSSTSSEKLRNVRTSTIRPRVGGILERLVDRDGEDDVGHDQHLEAEDDRPAHVVAKRRVRVTAASLAEGARVDGEADEAADHEDRDAGDLEGASAGSSACSNVTATSSAVTRASARGHEPAVGAEGGMRDSRSSVTRRSFRN